MITFIAISDTVVTGNYHETLHVNVHGKISSAMCTTLSTASFSQQFPGRFPRGNSHDRFQFCLRGNLGVGVLTSVLSARLFLIFILIFAYLSQHC